MTYCVTRSNIESMTTLLLTFYSDLKKLIKWTIVGTLILSCFFAYFDKQRIAHLKAEAHSEQSPSWLAHQGD